MIWSEGWDMRALTTIVSHCRLHSHHCGAPPHHWGTVGFGMWAPRHPCHGWKPGKLVILQWDGTNIVPNCCRFRRKILKQPWPAGQSFWCAVLSIWLTHRLDVDDPMWCQIVNFTQVRNTILKLRLMLVTLHNCAQLHEQCQTVVSNATFWFD